MTTDVRTPSLRDVIGVLEQMYDPAWARDWDAVGLVCGDPEAPVRRVLLAVDPVAAVVDEALAWRADLVLTHHPLFLRPVHGIPAGDPKGRLVHRLVQSGCALYAAHTNADAAVPGVSDALARVLGLTDLEPLAADPSDPVDKVVLSVPDDVAEKVVDALAAAGAGELGEYSRVAWSATGTGTFVAGAGTGGSGGSALAPGPEGTPGPGPGPSAAGPSTAGLSTAGLSMAGAGPRRDEFGRREEVTRRRVEMLFPRALRSPVIAALRSVHPDPELPFEVHEMASWSGPRGIGRVGRLSAPTTLREFALLVAEALPASAQGVRIAGDPTAEVSRVAVCGGAGDSLFDVVRACGADVYVTADLRHHPASEARERAGEGRPYLVDVSHWSSEWPWLAGVANRLEGAMEAAGAPIEVMVSNRCTDPWTFRVPSPGGVVR